MHAKNRQKFLDQWTENKYQSLVNDIDTATEFPAEFRICETPVFFCDEFASLIRSAGDDLVRQLQLPEVRKHCELGVPIGEEVPRCDDHPAFIQVDFAVAEIDGELVPQLIELQGFASMFCFQTLLDRMLRKNYAIPEDQSCYWSGLNEDSYLKLLSKVIFQNSDPKTVVLMEIEPSRQRTRIDFSATLEYLGIPWVCISDVKKVGRKLFAEIDGHIRPIERIYNRVIFDELVKFDKQREFNMIEDVDVEWVAHPNWFHKISKHTLPVLDSRFAPECYTLDNLPTGIIEDLQGFILKPLYSFAGVGVNLNPTQDDVNNIQIQGQDVSKNYLLQKRVKYAEFLTTPVGNRKAEIRLMYFWDKEPILANTLVRISKGSMSSVSKNLVDTWVGATTGYHSQEIS